MNYRRKVKDVALQFEQKKTNKNEARKSSSKEKKFDEKNKIK